MASARAGDLTIAEAHQVPGLSPSANAKPVIGITTYLEPARWSYWDMEVALVPTSYLRSVEAAGGRAVLIPPSAREAAETVSGLDALVLIGGADIAPDLYGQARHVQTRGVMLARDRAELALVEAASDAEMPVLAICRGSQVLNVARGGQLIQHLPEHLGHSDHKQQEGVFGEHPVRLDAGSRLATIVGAQLLVKSHHHQGFRRIGEGLRAVAWAHDGTPEAIEDPERPFLLGVLWHPEEDEDKRLFEALVEEAKTYREERAR